MSTDVESFFDPDTYTLTHLLTDAGGKHCVLIDPVLDYDSKSGCTSTQSADVMLARIAERNLSLDMILETHVHADHLTAASYIRGVTGARVATGGKVTGVQKTFTDIYNLNGDASTEAVFDHVFDDGEQIKIGDLSGYVMFTPGHTPSCVTYVFGDAAFIGDTLFAPDYGSARCDFPGGDGATLYNSIQRILSLSDDTRLFLCHDYMPNGRELVSHTTVAKQSTENIHLIQVSTPDAYAAMRAAKDATLSMPALILPSVQVNIRAGALPDAEDNGVQYLKIPLNKF